MNKQRKELAAAVVSDDDFADPRPQRIKHKSQHLRTPYNEGKSKAKAVVPKRKKVEPEGALPITRKRRKTKGTEVAPSTTIGNSVQIDGVLLEELVLTYAWHGVGDRNEELREVQDNTISLRKIDAESSKPSTMIEHNFIDCYGDYLNRQEVAKGGGVVSRWVFMTNLAQEVASIVDDMEAEKPQGLQERTEESYRNLVMDILEKCTWLPDKTLRDCKFWFFPLCTNQHFVVYCLDLKSRCFTFMNSVESVFHGSRYHKVGNMVLKHAIEFFGWNVHHPFKFKEFLWSESRDLGFRQTGNTACGVFALNFLEFWNGIMEPGWKERWDDPNYINERWSQCLKNLLLDEANLRRAYLEKKVVEDHAQLLQLSLSGEEGCGRPCPVASAEFSTLAMELPL